MISGLIAWVVGVVLASPSATVVAISAVVAAGWQRGHLPEVAVTWTGVLGVGFLAGRHVGAQAVGALLNWLTSLVAGIPILGDVLLGVIL